VLTNGSHEAETTSETQTPSTTNSASNSPEEVRAQPLSGDNAKQTGGKATIDKCNESTNALMNGAPLKLALRLR